MRRDLGFEVVSTPYGDGVRTALRFQCVECGAVLDVPKLKNTTNPEDGAARARAKGWGADAWRKNRCFCPACVNAERAANDPDSELKKKVVSMAQPVATPPPAVALVREITADQKQRIRALLDKHFDDAVGVYLDDQSDKTVAEAAGVPRIIVENIREAAYGPIRITAEIQAMRDECATLKEKVIMACREMEKVRAEVMTLASKLEKLAVGKAA
jgi:hypothetical protein